MIDSCGTVHSMEHVLDEVDRRVRQLGPHVDLAHLEADDRIALTRDTSITMRRR